MKLREHQITAINQIREEFRKNRGARVMVAAPCSFGKTVLAAHICKSYQDAGKRALFICDRIKLVDQTIDKFREFGINFSVIQAHHPLYNKESTVQIASAQSLENFRFWPDSDVIIVDEAHSMRKSVKEYLEKWDRIPFIGLSATPYSKGLGKYYKSLLVPTTPRELLSHEYLAPIYYYGGRQASLEGVKTKKLSTGGSDYLDKSLADAIEKDDILAGDIVKNWLKHAAGRMTIAFSPSVAHSKNMVDLFNSNGIPAAHIDGYMDREQQYDLYKAHSEGEFLILSCSRLLNTGYDEPGVSCLIDCYPTKSIIQYVQRAGRAARIADGKENAIYLDHAGNVSRHGFAEDIVPEFLDDGEKKYNERNLTKDKKEPKIKECPQCYGIMIGIKCKCGYEIPIREQIITDNQELEELHSVDAKNWNKKTSKEDKEKFYGMLKHYVMSRGNKPGRAAHMYRERAGVWPNAYKDAKPTPPNDEFKAYLAHLAIKRKYAA